MNRRSLIIAIGTATVLSGCLGDGSTDNGTDEEINGGNGEGAFDLWITNRTDEETTVGIEAVANGDEIVSNTYSVPDDTTETVTTVPEGTAELAVKATVKHANIEREERFDLTEKEPFEAVEIQLQTPENLQIQALAYDQPQ
jgi:hypothetical protein